MTAVEKRVRINATFAQLENLPAWVRYVILYGGRRSSKSFSWSQLIQKRGLKWKRKVVCLRKFKSTIRHSTWARVKAAVDESIGLDKAKVNESNFEITLPNGTQYYFVGADDPQKLKSLEGATDVVLEETNEFEEQDFDTLDAGLSPSLNDDEPPAQVWFSFNPIPEVEDAPHWIQTRFLHRVVHELSEVALSEELDCAILRTWYKDNAFCPKATVKLLESYKDTNPTLYEMWALGRFVRLEGVILKKWDVVNDVPQTVDFWGHGVDFGFADDPAVCVSVWGTRTDLWVRQRVYASEMTNPEFAAAMFDAGVKHGELLVADSAEPKSIKELQDAGLMVQPSEKGADYKRAAAIKLQGYFIHVTVESVDVRREVSTWSWMKNKKTGKPIPKPQDGNDHSIDALIGIVLKLRPIVKLPDPPRRDAPKPIAAGIRGRKF